LAGKKEFEESKKLFCISTRKCIRKRPESLVGYNSCLHVYIEKSSKEMTKTTTKKAAKKTKPWYLGKRAQI